MYFPSSIFSQGADSLPSNHKTLLKPPNKIRIFVDAHVFDSEYQGTRTFIREIYLILAGKADLELYLAACDIENLKKENVLTLAIEQVESSIFLQDFKIEKDQKYALVFGNEVYGVAQEAVAICDGCIEIPQLGTKHSLNIAVSAGIVVWDLFQKINWSENN